MAKLSTDELLDAFKEMTLIELSEFVKQFEETFEVTAAAPVAAAPAAGAGGAAPAEEEEKDSFDVVLDRRRREEDPGHQGGPRAHEPRPQGGQGPRRRRPQARPRGCRQGCGREGQGPARGRRRDRRAQVICPGQPGSALTAKAGPTTGRARLPCRRRCRSHFGRAGAAALAAWSVGGRPGHGSLPYAGGRRRCRSHHHAPLPLS